MFVKKVAGFWDHVKKPLFPWLEDALEEPLTPQHRRFILVLDLLGIERFIRSPHAQKRLGRLPKDRRCLARAFVAEACWNLTETTDLVDRLRVDRVLRKLCGWETVGALPSEATFSRAFAAFAEAGLLDRVHAVLVKEHLGDTVTLHVSRDATAIEVRERPVKKLKPEKTETSPKRKQGRRRKGEAPPPEPTRLQRQRTQTAEEALAELPTACDVGCKRNAKGYKETWIGRKFHVDTTDEGIPLTAITTSASLHDSQVAIPLMRLTSDRIPYCYEVMDSAYDAKEIREMAAELGHVAITERNPRRGEAPEWEPDRKRHFNARSGSERFNARLKDDCAARMVRVRGAAKVHTYLMFGLLVVFAEAVLGLLP